MISKKFSILWLVGLTLAGFIFGAYLSSLFFVGRYAVTEDDVKSKLAAEYFRRLSVAGLAGSIHFDDCTVRPATGSVLKSGTAKYYGECVSSVNGRTIVLSVGLSEGGYVVFTEEGPI